MGRGEAEYVTVAIAVTDGEAFAGDFTEITLTANSIFTESITSASMILSFQPGEDYPGFKINEGNEVTTSGSVGLTVPQVSQAVSSMNFRNELSSSNWYLRDAHIESDDPYDKYQYTLFTLEEIGAEKLKIHIAEMEMWENLDLGDEFADYLRIYDESGWQSSPKEPIWEGTGVIEKGKLDPVWTPEIPGSKAYIRIEVNPYYGYAMRGFHIDAIMAYSKWSEPEPWSSSRSWELSSGDGLKRVWFQQWSENGDYSTGYDEIIYDGSKPKFSNFRPTERRISNQRPDCSIDIQDVFRGLDVSSIGYKYSMNGGTTWVGDNNGDWISLSCPGSEGDTDVKRVTAFGVPFDQDSTTNNKIKFRAVDISGNVGFSAEYTVKIDSTPPSISITSPEDDSIIESYSVKVTWTGSDTTSGMDRYDIRLNNGQWIDKGLATSHTFNDLSMGIHTAYVRAYDKVGHENTAEIQFEVKDVTSPVFSNFSPTGWWAEDQTPTCSVDIHDNFRGIDVETVEYRYITEGNDWSGWETVDFVSGQQGDLSVSATVYDVPFNTDSTTNNNIKFRAVDISGNERISSEYTVKIDTTPPTVVITTPSDGEILGTRTITVEWIADYHGLSEISKYEIRLNDGNWINKGLTKQHTFKDLPVNQELAVTVRVHDSAGNSDTDSVQFMIEDISPPEFSKFKPDDWWIEDQIPDCSVDIYDEISGVDVNSIEYRYSRDGGISWTLWSSVDQFTGTSGDNRVRATVFNVPFLQDSADKNVIQFRVSDMVGHEVTSDEYIVKVDKNVPRFNNFSPVDWVTTQTPTCTVDVQDASGLDEDTVEVYYTTNNGQTWTTTSFEVINDDGSDTTLTIRAENVPFHTDYRRGSTKIKFVISNQDQATPVDTQVFTQNVKIDTTPPGKPGRPELVREWEPSFRVRRIDYDGNYEIHWSSASDFSSGVSHYLIYEKRGSQSWQNIGSSSTTSIEVLGRVAGNTYYYKVKAVDNVGLVGPDSEVSLSVEVVPIQVNSYGPSRIVINRDPWTLDYDIVNCNGVDKLTGAKLNIYLASSPHSVYRRLVKEIPMETTVGNHVINWDGIEENPPERHYLDGAWGLPEPWEYIFVIEYQFNNGNWKERYDYPHPDPFIGSIEVDAVILRLRRIGPPWESEVAMHFENYPYDDFVAYKVMASFDGIYGPYEHVLSTITKQDLGWYEYRLDLTGITHGMWIRVFVVNDDNWQVTNRHHYPRSNARLKRYLSERPVRDSWYVPRPWEPGSPTCPYLYVFNSTDSAVRENNILPQSEVVTNYGSDVTDRYIIQNEVQEVDGAHILGVSEFEREVTYLNAVGLYSINHPVGTNVVSDKMGNIYMYKQIVPPTFAEHEGRTVDEIYEEDGIGFSGKKGETIDITFENIDASSGRVMLYMRSDGKSDVFSQHLGADWGKFTTSMIVQIKLFNGEWENISVVSPREEWSSQVIDLTDYMAQEHSSLEFRLKWTSNHNLDFVGIAPVYNIPESHIIKHQLIHADHTYLGDVTSAIRWNDDANISIRRGEGIKLHYDPIDVHNGMDRKFMFESVGWYRPIGWIEPYQYATINIHSPLENNVKISVIESNQLGNRNKLSVGDCISGFSSIIEFKRYTQREYSVVVEALSDVNSHTMTMEFVGDYSTVNLTHHIPSGTEGDILAEINIEEILSSVTGVSYNRWRDTLHFKESGIISYFTVRDKVEIEEYGVDNLFWTFSDVNVSRSLRNDPAFKFKTEGKHIISVGAITSGGVLYDARSFLEIYINHRPVPSIDVYQTVDVEIRIAGRKENHVALVIYEDGEEVDKLHLTREPGIPNTQCTVLKFYDGRNYTMDLVYNATHRGSNPIFVRLSSRTGSQEIKQVFNTENGFNQLITYEVTHDLAQVLSEDRLYHFSGENSYDLDGEIIAYHWDFGDGNTAEGATVNHEYISPGEYIIRLTVVDDRHIAAVKEILLIVP